MHLHRHPTAGTFIGFVTRLPWPSSILMLGGGGGGGGGGVQTSCSTKVYSYGVKSWASGHSPRACTARLS